MSEKRKLLFEDLGKPTLRGVRKCPKCGTYNGTRGNMCKNKECKLIFRVTKEKKSEFDADAVKVITTSPYRLFSVRQGYVHKERRCFVSLPVIQGIETLQNPADVNYITQNAARCHASECQKAFGDAMTPFTVTLAPCQHVISIVNCSAQAKPLPLKHSVLNAMPMTDEVRQEIWALAAKSDDHLVQRVSKNAMIVKCQMDEDNLFGFLHLSVHEPVKGSKKYRVLCDCHKGLTNPVILIGKRMCVHFHACVCAFASDPELAEEFQRLIQLVITMNTIRLQQKSVNGGNNIDNPNHINSMLAGEIQPEANTDDQLGNDVAFQSSISDMDFIHVSVLRNQCVGTCDDVDDPNYVNNIFSGEIQSETNANDPLAVINLLLPENSSAKKPAKSPKKTKNSCKVQLESPVVDEALTSVGFHEWLASVTERINETMHYQFDGNPEPLVFHVPQKFFDCLQQRISAGSRKKRLPNATLRFLRKDTLPMGVFSRYIWNITNILHVKQIFDTSEMPLEITRSFIQRRDGNYEYYEPPQNDPEDLTESFRKANNLLIKPLELKTFLKVGNMSLDQKQPTPFMIEWIPDVFPKSHIGELRIKFEYGHQKNGAVEDRSKDAKRVKKS